MQEAYDAKNQTHKNLEPDHPEVGVAQDVAAYAAVHATALPHGGPYCEEAEANGEAPGQRSYDDVGLGNRLIHVMRREERDHNIGGVVVVVIVAVFVVVDSFLTMCVKIELGRSAAVKQDRRKLAKTRWIANRRENVCLWQRDAKSITTIFLPVNSGPNLRRKAFPATSCGVRRRMGDVIE